NIIHANEVLNEFCLDILCLMEIWLLESNISVITDVFPRFHYYLLLDMFGRFISDWRQFLRIADDIFRLTRSLVL
ncbi:hypothetical protein CGJ15_27540, partial [Vibrio parahaemolyticus]